MFAIKVILSNIGPKRASIPAVTSSLSSPFRSFSSICRFNKDNGKDDTNQIRVAPSARALLEEYGIEDLEKIKATGYRGYILKCDVLAFIKEHDLKSTLKELREAFSKGYVPMNVSRARRKMVKRLSKSKSEIPHSYMSIRCDTTILDKTKSSFGTLDIQTSATDILVKTVGIALKAVPEMNCRWDSYFHGVELINHVNISLAVDTPDGLVTPVIFNANKLSISEISKVSADLISRAKENQLESNETIKGTFSISNLGEDGVDHYSAIIPPGQSAVLTVGRSKKYFDENLNARSRMVIQLCYDARAIEEETAANFLQTIKDTLSSPFNLMESGA